MLLAGSWFVGSTLTAFHYICVCQRLRDSHRASTWMATLPTDPSRLTLGWTVRSIRFCCTIFVELNVRLPLPRILKSCKDKDGNTGHMHRQSKTISFLQMFNALVCLLIMRNNSYWKINQCIYSGSESRYGIYRGRSTHTCIFNCEEFQFFSLGSVTLIFLWPNLKWITCVWFKIFLFRRLQDCPHSTSRAKHSRSWLWIYGSHRINRLPHHPALRYGPSGSIFAFLPFLIWTMNYEFPPWKFCLAPFFKVWSFVIDLREKFSNFFFGRGFNSWFIPNRLQFFGLRECTVLHSSFMLSTSSYILILMAILEVP